MASSDPRGFVRPVWYAGSESMLGELWTMLHLPYTLMVLSFVVVGSALAPHISWLILGGTLLAYFLGLGIGSHFLDQVPGMGSRYVRHWPDWALWTGGFVALSAAVALGIAGALWFVGLPLLVLVGIQTLCAVGYPLAKWLRGAFHRDSVFAVSWGSLPFLTSYYAQTGSISLAAILLAVTFGAVAVVEIRLSRISRKLRAAARDRVSGDPLRALGTRPPYRDLDIALQALSSGTILLALGLLATRVMLEVW